MINPVEIKLMKMGVHYGLTWRCEGAITALKRGTLAKLIGEPNQKNIHYGTHTGEVVGLPYDTLQEVAKELIWQ